MITKQSQTLTTFPVITREHAQAIEHNMRFAKNVRKTIERDGVYYDIREMTDEQADKVWNELH